MLTADTVLTYLRDDLMIEDPITPDDALFSSGLLDSVAMMNLITFLEEKTGGDVRPSDVTLDHFDSIDRIVAYAATLA